MPSEYHCPSCSSPIPMDDINVSTDIGDYKDIPYFELLEVAGKERDIEKRRMLFELSNAMLEREFRKLKHQERRSKPS